MCVGREEDERADNHDVGKHADGEKRTGEQVKHNHGHKSERAGFSPEEQERNGEVVSRTRPTKCVGKPILLHKLP